MHSTRSTSNHIHQPSRIQLRMIKRLLPIVLVIAAPLSAQTSLPGYSPQSSSAERATEADAISRPSPAKAAEQSRFLSSQPHMAGTPAQARTRDYVVSQMKSWGLETEVRTYKVWMPHPVSTRVWRISPSPIELSLAEGPIAEDTTSVAFPQILAFNGYGAAGDVRGDVVYVNYGLIEDYAQLDSMGISVKGKIAVARYGRSFRGIKAREAEKHGALGLLIYSDPADDGYVRGDVYPAGPMRPSNGIQRGSVMPADGQGFLNPPSGRWWLGIDIYLGKSARYGRGKILLEMFSRLHADKSGHDRQRLRECNGSTSVSLESGKRGVNLAGEGSSKLRLHQGRTCNDGKTESASSLQ